MRRKIGTRIGTEYFSIYPKKLGMGVPASSAIDRTMKFGALPMYVKAPKNTAPAEIATRYKGLSWIKSGICCDAGTPDANPPRAEFKKVR